MADDRNTPATKGDLQDLKDEFLEALRDNQTELLRAFYSFAQSTETKLKDTEVADFMLRQRLTAVEARLLEVEKRLNFPNPKLAVGGACSTSHQRVPPNGSV
jgi:hypothetical protein